METRISEWGLSDMLRFIGVRSDIPRLMRAADVLLFPSVDEGLGMVAVEAQAAGLPVLSPENHEGELAVDISLFSLRSPHDLFALKVKGESMIDAHILDGDTVIVRVQSAAQSGDIVVALVNGEATVKRLFWRKAVSVCNLRIAA